MHQTLRWIGITLWSLLSLDIAIGIIDWFGRWDWLTAQMVSHPRLAAFLHTPFIYIAPLVLGFLFLLAERKVHEPKLVARYTNARIVPNTISQA